MTMAKTPSVKASSRFFLAVAGNPLDSHAAEVAFVELTRSRVCRCCATVARPSGPLSGLALKVASICTASDDSHAPVERQLPLSSRAAARSGGGVLSRRCRDRESL